MGSGHTRFFPLNSNNKGHLADSGLGVGGHGAEDDNGSVSDHFYFKIKSTGDQVEFV